MFSLIQPKDHESLSLNFIFPIKYVSPQSFKVGHRLSKFYFHDYGKKGIYRGIIILILRVTLPETNVAPENRPPQ